MNECVKSHTIQYNTTITIISYIVMCGAVQPSQTSQSRPSSESTQQNHNIMDNEGADRRPSIVIEDQTDNNSLLSTGNATGSGRTRVALKPGHSLMDWIRLCAKSSSLSGTNGEVIVVSLEELAKHKTVDDCWICIRGKVYNVTPYLDFHPGGVEEMMRGAGTDATDLFNEIHRYVNYESMLKKCFVGPLLTN